MNKVGFDEARAVPVLLGTCIIQSTYSYGSAMMSWGMLAVKGFQSHFSHLNLKELVIHLVKRTGLRVYFVSKEALVKNGVLMCLMSSLMLPSCHHLIISLCITAGGGLPCQPVLVMFTSLTKLNVETTAGCPIWETLV